MRHLTFFTGLLACSVAVAQTPPPGQIVIEPKKPGATAPAEPARPGGIAVLKGTDPDHPGFIVFAPNKAAASKLLPAPTPTTNVDKSDGVPTITIIGSGAKQPPADPTKPTPGGGSKPAPPEEKVTDGKILIETYDVGYCRGCKVSYMHTLVREYERDGKKLLYGVKRLTLQVARFGQPVEQWLEESSIETPDGKVLHTSCRQGFDSKTLMEMAGDVTDKGLEVTITGAAKAKEVVPWPEGVVGVAKEATLLRDMKPKAGTAVEFRTYTGLVNGIVTYKFRAVGTEEADPDGTGKKRKLVKVIEEMVPVKIEGGEFKQPPVTLWLDPDTYDPVALESDMAPLGGTVTAKRATREVALAKPTKYLDIGEMQSIKLPAAVPGIHDKDSVTYHVILGGDVPLDKAFASDGRQTVKITDEKARTLDITVTAVRSPVKPKVPPPAPGKEYLSSSSYIDWDDDLVKKHAAAAVAGLPKAASDWEKAQAVEKWVRTNMKQVEFSQAMAPCKTVAKELSGDCTEHAMLAVGMCRALGIPSRTALGLVYAPTRDGGAQLAYHMWFEVWADGSWVALDAIMGKGSVGPGHIKITDAHWDGEKGFTPLLPVMGVLAARPQVTVGK